jgi:spermidine synthase
VTAADARRFVRASTQRYDLIVSDNFHPARSGSGSLYTVEHFEAVRDRLEADGLFCQWLPLHQLDLDTLRSIVASFLAVYPKGAALLATNSLETPVLGLVARRDGQHWRPAQVRERLFDARLALQPAEFGLADEWALLGSFVAGPASLATFSAGAIANTDDRPIVAHQAPRITYLPDSLPRDRLLAFLQQTQVSSDELVDDAGEAGWSARLDGYWRARNRFLDVGRNVRPSAEVTRMLAQVHQPLLEVLRLSPDFAPAYDPLLSMAVTLGHTDSHAARALLRQLVEIQPARQEARRALARLGG